jgi:hypothetical protein
MLGITLAAMGFRRSFSGWEGPTAILISLAVAMAGQGIVAYGVQRATQVPALRLPFVSARLVADGPGTDYLRATCPASGFALCEDVSKFPMIETDFLFGETPGHSVYDPADYERRKQISREELRFAVAVFEYDPMGVGLSAVRNFAGQLAKFGLSDFSYRLRIKAIDGSLPPGALRQVRSSRAYLGTLHESILSAAVYVSTLISLLVLLAVVFGVRGVDKARSACRGTIVWILVGIVVNAGVCGCLSGVDDRYQARVIWLLPLVALLCCCYATRSVRGLPQRGGSRRIRLSRSTASL